MSGTLGHIVPNSIINKNNLESPDLRHQKLYHLLALSCYIVDIHKFLFKKGRVKIYLKQNLLGTISIGVWYLRLL